MRYNEVEMVELGELKFVGISVTSSFKGHHPQRIEDAKRIFLNRKDEIQHVLHQDRYVCPHFASEVLFTYFFCMEVSSLDNIPEGMLGFSVPAHKYAKTRSDHDPYQVIQSYLKTNGIENHVRGISFEIYSFDNPEWPKEVDVYMPVRNKLDGSSM